MKPPATYGNSVAATFLMVLSVLYLVGSSVARGGDVAIVDVAIAALFAIWSRVAQARAQHRAMVNLIDRHAGEAAVRSITRNP